MTRGLKQAFLIGITAGMRCFLAPAILVSRESSCGRAVKLATTIAAVGELVADKTPYIGSRLDAGPLAGRVVAGALCGGRVAANKESNAVLGAAVGGLAAFASAHFFYHVRRTTTEAGVPDFAFALAEDTAAIAIASNACREG
ncbi:MAG: DUF4126 family protein [Pyrinomonadaceae bacterium]